MPHIVKTQCRICASSLTDVLNLGDFALSDFVEQGVEVERVPLVLAQCPECSLVQLRHTVDRDRMYRRYWYVSGLNQSMVEALEDVVRGVKEKVELEPGDTVIDIGANDGTLLGFYDEALFRVGFDPAKNLTQNNCDLFVNDYFESNPSYSDLGAKVITSIAMFYDLDDPKKFVTAIAQTLAPDGVWVVQMTDLVRMLKINAFDSICHEHLCYYSLPVFAKLVEGAGLRVFDLETNDVNGGSIRIYVCHQDAAHVTQPSVPDMLDAEKQYLDDGAIEKFTERVERIKKTVVDFVRKKVSEGKRFHAMGASTKGNTLLQYFDLGTAEIEAAAEVNPEKYGLVTAGTGIPIISQEESLSTRPDYYLVLPWHFIVFLLKKHAGYLKSGGALVVPLPKPAVHKVDSAFGDELAGPPNVKD